MEDLAGFQSAQGPGAEFQHPWDSSICSSQYLFVLQVAHKTGKVSLPT